MMRGRGRGIERRGLLRAVVIVLCWSGTAARADVWDLGGDSDNGIGTDNELVHGAEQVHDVAAQQGGTVDDEDWYRIQVPRASSFEVIFDGMTGDVANTTEPVIRLFSEDGSGIVAVGTPVTSFGMAQSLIGFTPIGGGGPGDETRYAVLYNPACALNCTASDQYRVRFYDTTLSLPRFNNSNGQVTTLVLHNQQRSRDATIFVAAFRVDGTYVDTHNFTLPPYGSAVLNLSTILGGALNNMGGSLLVFHTARYGQLTGKAVALEPATGFTFDTPLLQRP